MFGQACSRGCEALTEPWHVAQEFAGIPRNGKTYDGSLYCNVPAENFIDCLEQCIAAAAA